ncbi:hypothetical protein ONE63_006032 [Megalurothrips usitatus]|uniref:Exonuclease domain-containing protein n=1 Tax=Megalurothrips usitatus TaxID=439358 RepID=A0AAV7XST2_9NEOP|nr:hypothetical protein ONE63_006032 [Megalurothrips usitatus]
MSELEKRKGKLWRTQNKINKVKALLDISSLNDKERQEIAAFKAQDPLKTDGSQTKHQRISDQCDETSNGEPKSKKFKEDNGAELSPNVSIDSSERPTLSEDQKEELRRLLKERRKMLKRVPRFQLGDVGMQAELTTSATERVPIFCSDLQNLLLHSLFPLNYPAARARWFSMDRVGSLKSVQILFIEGAGISDYLKSEEQLTALSDSNFKSRLEVIMPAVYGGDTIEEFCLVPLSRIQGIKLTQGFPSLEEAVKTSKYQLYKVLRTYFPIKTKEEEEKSENSKTETPLQNSEEQKSDQTPETKKIELHPNDKFPRTNLLLSPWQMIEEGYPLLLNANMKEEYKDFVHTKTSYKEVTNLSPMYGVDCEMCQTTRYRSELTRVSIVNEKLETVYDSLVKPPNKIINYLTEFSGITAEMMKNVTTKLADVQKFIQENIEPDAIFVGQSLNFDLKALKMLHPYCIDTGVIFNITGDRYKKTKLKILTQKFLAQTIQAGSHGHDSVEDSSAALRLVQLKLSKSIEFGDQVLSGVSCPDAKKHKELLDVSGYATSLFHHTSINDRQVTITACPDVIEKYVDYINPKILTCVEVNEDGSCDSLVTSEAKSGQVTCYVAPSNDHVTKRVATGESLSIYHLQLSEQERDELAIGDPSIVQRVNQWTSRLKQSACDNSLSIVVFCGRELSASGVGFVSLNAEPPPRLSFVPKNPCSGESL